MKGKELRELRQKLGLTQKELAARLGYKRLATLSEYENDKTTAPLMYELVLRCLVKQAKGGGK